MLLVPTWPRLSIHLPYLVRTLWWRGWFRANSNFLGLIAFFEFLWYLERWNGQRTVLGVIAVVFIQRAINKFIISTLLSRESKSDETNRVWWSGTWFAKANAGSGVSSPAREFLVKIVELSLWSGDFILGHILLFFLTIPTLIPYADKLHSTMLCKFSFRFAFCALH